MTSERDYVKEIIDEYNIRLQEWGRSDTWTLTEFKMLEDLIYGSSRIRINANTLRRFFQQQTSSPQLATKNALCIFLGYESYSDFVMKKTKKVVNVSESFDGNNKVAKIKKDVIDEEETSNDKKKSRNKWLRRKVGSYSLYIGIIAILLFIVGVTFYSGIVKWYKEYLISRIRFEAVQTKGTSPLTVKFEYSIPESLFDSIYVIYEESNGDTIRKPLEKNMNVAYMTYIYVGKSLCYLKYGNRTLKTIRIETRTSGWSSYVREERQDFFCTRSFNDVYTGKGYISMSIQDISKNILTDKLFVSYTYYKEGLVDGDNFMVEARVRNSKEDHGIPCYDAMMYVFSDTGLHGFSINQNCYSYIKFISGEKTITGDKYDFRKYNFDTSDWHIMRIQVVNRETTFYFDDEPILNTVYENSLGKANEITLRFKGCGAVDYVKLYDSKNQLIYENDFEKNQNEE